MLVFGKGRDQLSHFESVLEGWQGDLLAQLLDLWAMVLGMRTVSMCGETYHGGLLGYRRPVDARNMQ